MQARWIAMKIYFDESGNTGCLTREGRETYCGKDGQSLYALGAVLSPEKGDENLTASYEAFKERCGAAGREVKGSDLLTRKCNDQLSDFFETFLECGRFKICLYSKDFYLATALMQTVLGSDAKIAFPQLYYLEASNLALFGAESLKAYAEFSAMPNASGARVLTERLLVNPDAILAEGSFLHAGLRRVVETGRYDILLRTDIASGGYEKPSYQNLVNLTAFGELLAIIKEDEGISNASLELVHDRIPEFEREYRSALVALGLGCIVKFEESNDCLGIQLADNVASVVGGVAKRVTAACKANIQWGPESEWIMSLWSKLLDAIGLDNFKLVVPLQDQAMLLSIGRMFCTGFPVEYRNNSVFNELYRNNLNWALIETDRVRSHDDAKMDELLRM